MHLESEDLVHQFAKDWPQEFERSRDRLLIAQLTRDKEALIAELEQYRSGGPLDRTSVMPAYGTASVAPPNEPSRFPQDAP